MGEERKRNRSASDPLLVVLQPSFEIDIVLFLELSWGGVES